MRTRRQHQAGYGPDVDELSRRLTEWRQAHKPPTRIPAELWTKAAELAGQHGIAPMAKALRLDYAALRQRMRPQPARESSAAAFMEWVAPSAALIEDCSLEIESRRGARMRIHVKSVSPSGLANIIRDFAA